MGLGAGFGDFEGVVLAVGRVDNWRSSGVVLFENSVSCLLCVELKEADACVLGLVGTCFEFLEVVADV